MDDKPPIRCLVAKYFAFHWQTKCVRDDDVPALLKDGWLNYMRDPFDLDAANEWALNQAWDAHQALQQERQKKRIG